jgi:arylsulfatase
VTGVDMAIGKVVDRLEKNGELEDSLIVVCSDHGDMLGDHRMLGKGYQMYYDEVMRVPCVLYWPKGFGSEGMEVHGLIEMVDLMPTLLELCGAHVPDMMVGQSCAGDLREGRIPEGREEVIAYSIADSGMLRTAEFEYCRFPVHGTEVLFDLRSDPQERSNIARSHRNTRDLMRDKMLDRFLSASRSYRAHYHLF